MEVGCLASRSQETNKKSLPWTVATQVKTLQGDQDRQTGRLENIQREDAVTTSFHQLDFPIVNLPIPLKKGGKEKVLKTSWRQTIYALESQTGRALLGGGSPKLGSFGDLAFECFQVKQKT